MLWRGLWGPPVERQAKGPQLHRSRGHNVPDQRQEPKGKSARNQKPSGPQTPDNEPPDERDPQQRAHRGQGGDPPGTTKDKRNHATRRGGTARGGPRPHATRGARPPCLSLHLLRRSGCRSCECRTFQHRGPRPALPVISWAVCRSSVGSIFQGLPLQGLDHVAGMEVHTSFLLPVCLKLAETCFCFAWACLEGVGYFHTVEPVRA